GRLSMGMLLAFQALMLAFLSPVNRLVSMGGSLLEVGAGLDRLDDVLRSRAEPAGDVGIADAEGGVDGGADGAGKLAGHVELRRVSFGYSRLDPALIQDFSLVLAPGSRVALVGGSGSGKSTVARLVAGLYEPWAGEILFDGVPREQLSRA